MIDIAIDIDDTLCNTSSVISDVAKNYHLKVLKRDYNPVKIDSCEDYFYFAHELMWSDEDVTMFFKDCYPYYLSNVKPLNDVAETLQKLKKRGCIIHIISARHYNNKVDVVELTRNWLSCYKIPYDTLDIGFKDKVEIVKNYNCKVFIDDSFKNCCDITNNIADIVPIMFETDFNKNLGNNEVKKVANWKEIENFLCILMRNNI